MSEPSRPLKILIVDDSAAMRSIIRRELAPLGGAVFEEAENGERAIEVANRFLPDLITLDLDMPVMSGYEACEDLKISELTMNIPVVVISGHPSDSERLRALVAGAVEYYVKPFTEGALRQFVTDLFVRLREHRQQSIFVLQPSRPVRRATGQILERFGYSVRLFENAEETTMALRLEHCDLLVLDLDLPHFGGIGLLQDLRRQPAFERLPVLAVTGSAARKDLVVAFSAGATDLLRKPFFPEELLVRVENQLRVLALENQLREDATLDPLTGLYNRRELTRLFRIEVSRALRDRHPLGAILVDVDHFKAVNDTHGHPVGDMVLKGIGGELFKRVRTTDIVGRYGGEEFAVLLPKATAPGVGLVAERTRLSLETIGFTAGEKTFHCTVSFGGTWWTPEALGRQPTFEEFFKPADEALYQSKANGRNRTTLVDCEGRPIDLRGR